MIRFEQATVTYPGGVTALDGIDLEIADGEFVVIVGLSGAGKSTLIRTVNGLVPPTGGAVHVGDREVGQLSKRQLRSLRADVGMIFQHFNLVNRTTVLNNVLMGRLNRVPGWRSMLGMWGAEEIEVAMQALEVVEIVDKAYVRASNLSGGQQQRVGIARALAQQPTVLLADEPVASLDPPTSHSVMRYLQKINREMGITTLVNLHFLDLAREYADRVIGLRGGRLVFDGPGAEADEKVFEQIYGRSLTADDVLEAEAAL
ncbi:phosphonate ABC transporter ATP-binding protein [Phytoactinopolyspora mesophila]|uniref:Phosphonate ABC transporter ATP-binding protein n=1 Tax=Phytoactinopolyspora mesophila TaxID=2650750 RepID=A0A7K3M9T3_9ACTN|nr:phosphonate ABC transporter ATP-binding protein [Phytoactinopolyspora mesophila]NDL59722.1 phosphonate ABC transporter ATP-binding protein [Phytoactinopolyspora mesophila]